MDTTENGGSTIENATMVGSTKNTNNFEYFLNVPTVVHTRGNGTPVFYMDRGRLYDFKVKVANSVVKKETKLYFNIQLDPVEEQYRQYRDKLITIWAERHPETRMLEVDSDSDDSSTLPGHVMYDPKKPNMIRLVTECAGGENDDEMAFKLKVNCLPQQFRSIMQELVTDSSGSGFGFGGKVEKEDLRSLSFFLMVTIYSDTTGAMLDTTLCQIRTFWRDRAQPNFESDRYAIMDSNPGLITCPEKYQLLQTILNPLPPSSTTNEHECDARGSQEHLMDFTFSEPALSASSKNPFRKFPNLANDERLFVCRLNAPLNLAQTTTYLDKETYYELLITPMSINTGDTVLQTQISLDFPGDIPASQLSTALSNWSIINQKKLLLELDFECSKLDDSVLDVYQDQSKVLNLVWVPTSADELKLRVKFNCETGQLARFLSVNELKMDLVVETSGLKEKIVLEKSNCPIRIFDTGVSARQFQVDQTESSLANTKSFHPFTIMANIRPKNVTRKKAAVPTPNASITSSPAKKLHVDSNTPSSSNGSSSSSSSSFKLNIKIHELYLDDAKLVTLQERLCLENQTVDELERKLLELLKRKSRKEANFATIFLQDTQITDEMLGVMVTDGSGYKCYLITNDEENGIFLAYLNPYNSSLD